MLVFAAKVGEKVLVADNCYVKVVGRQGNTIRLGFEFPVEVPVDRETRRAVKSVLRVHERGKIIYQKE